MDPTKKELYTAKRSSGLDTSCPQCSQLITNLRSDTDPTNWILLKVAGTTLSAHGSGSNGLPELIRSINDDDVFYGAVKSSVKGQIKFYHIYFVGNNVNGMKKGKASLYKSTVFGLIEAHGEISCATGISDFTIEFVMNELAKLTKANVADIVI